MNYKVLLMVFLVTGSVMNLNAQTSKEKEKEEAKKQKEGETESNYGLWHYSMFNPRSSQRVSLNLSKHFMGETISSEVDFEVAEDQSDISISLTGSCKNGEITVTIKLPNGDILKSQKITNAADIGWSAVIPIKEEERKYVGTWKLEIKAERAEGHYNLHLISK
jgi:hypothetical protein